MGRKGKSDGRLLRLATTSGLRKGLLGGSRFWLIVGGASTGYRLLRRLTGGGPEVVYSEELPAGQSLVISNSSDPR